MNLDEWREQAAKAAYEVWRTWNGRAVWDVLEPRAQSLWRDVAHAVIGEGRIEMRPSAELAEFATREENARLLKIGREWAETATSYREAAERNLADFRTVSAQLEVLREALALGEASDGHHTHNELYSYRLLYNAHAALAFRAAGWKIVRSYRHSDGELCFGGPDWFVVHAETPAGQITNHYKRQYWHHFVGIDEVERAPEWDGHTPEVAAMRLEASIEFLRQRFDEMAKRPAPVGREDTAWLVRGVGREHIRRCEIEQCDTCSEVLGIEERVNLLDDTTRACTGCADPRCVACTGVFRPGGIPRCRTMTKPKVIGYAEEWEGPIGGTLGVADMSTARFVRTRPIYAPRPFRATPTHDGYRLNGWKLYCCKCQTATMSTVRLPHDLAVSHECLYDPEQVEQS